MSERVLKHHVTAALGALGAGPYGTLEEAAAALALAVVESEGPTRWVVITNTPTTPTAYGPYASAATARKAIDSGLMLGEQAILLAMQPVPRKGHRNPKENQ